MSAFAIAATARRRWARRSLPARCSTSGRLSSRANPSSEALDRVFCKVCGTRLFSRRTNGTVVGVALAVFDDRNAFAPTEHIWVSEKMAWLRLDDDLPQYQETVP
jgi:hypothetical protein